jgi:lipoyl(octanoyl) transferase
LREDRERRANSVNSSALDIVDLGRLAYAPAYEEQLRRHADVVARRQTGGPPGTMLLLEHDPPVITVSRRPEARAHLLATEEALALRGIEVRETDRGGDITYHGPGQLVAYPIVDLSRLDLGLVDYLRLLESVVIDVCAGFGVSAGRDRCATGVWVGGSATDAPGGTCAPSGGAKICAMGVRVRRWVTLHGLALNVSTNLEHFGLIVPCGLAGRPVTSLQRELGDRAPSMSEVKAALALRMSRAVEGLFRKVAPGGTA